MGNSESASQGFKDFGNGFVKGASLVAKPVTSALGNMADAYVTAETGGMLGDLGIGKGIANSINSYYAQGGRVQGMYATGGLITKHPLYGKMVINHDSPLYKPILEAYQRMGLKIPNARK